MLNKITTPFRFKCVRCKNQATKIQYCSTCSGYGICISCAEDAVHNHSLDLIDFNLEDESISRNPNDQSQMSINRFLISLTHSVFCDGCTDPMCTKFKSIMIHAFKCRRKSRGGCAVCIHLQTILEYHGFNCEEDHCKVLGCHKTKMRSRGAEKHLE